MQSEIVTDRLRLRRTRPGDYPAVLALVSDFDVVKMTASWPWPADPGFTRGRCVPVDPARGMAGVVLAGAEIIGMMGVTTQENDGVVSADIGYMFARKHWGRGYATEMARALIDHVFAHYDWPAIEAGIWADNPASGRVLEKLGFVRTGEGPFPCVARGQELMLHDFTLTRADWQARHG